MQPESNASSPSHPVSLAELTRSGIGTDLEIAISYCTGRAPSNSEDEAGTTTCVKRVFLDRSSRLVFAAEALAGFWLHPFLGNGLATFELWMPSPDTGAPQVYRYPHNLLLEVAFEGGTIGFAILVLALGLVIRACWQAGQKEAIGPYVLGFLVFIFASALVSGDFYDSRLFWLTAFALIAWQLAKPIEPIQDAKRTML